MRERRCQGVRRGRHFHAQAPAPGQHAGRLRGRRAAAPAASARSERHRCPACAAHADRPRMCTSSVGLSEASQQHGQLRQGSLQGNEEHELRGHASETVRSSGRGKRPAARAAAKRLQALRMAAESRSEARSRPSQIRTCVPASSTAAVPAQACIADLFCVHGSLDHHRAGV